MERINDCTPIGPEAAIAARVSVLGAPLITMFYKMLFPYE